MTAARLLILAAAVATLSACNREREAAPARTEATAAASAASPLSYESRTPYAEVELSLPPELNAEPELRQALYDEETRALRQFAEGAQADRTEAGAPTDMPPYSKDITLTTAAQTPKLLSLKRADFDFSGGAHPNTLQSGVLWDRAEKRRLTGADLFRPGADLTVLDQALCTAVNAAKRERQSDAETVTLDGDGMFKCPRAASTPYVLAPSTEAGKVAGLTFLIDPYQVGPYVEGAYEIDLALPVFRSLLAPGYASEFGGQLRPAA